MVSAIGKKFYDTCALLASVNNEHLFDESFYVSSVTLHELEHIKVSRNKDEDIKYKSRKLTHLLDLHHDKYTVMRLNVENLDFLRGELRLDITVPDNQILASAYCLSMQNKGQMDFVTNDIYLKNLGRSFGLSVESVSEFTDDGYTGYVEKSLSEIEMAYFYEHIQENTHSLLPNQYLIIKNINGEIIDKFKWSGEEYQNVKIPNVKSNYFGVVKPYNGDIYQQLALNSLTSNQVTMIKGVAGTGKSYLALGFLLSQLEKKKIEKIIIFCNTIATINSAKLGYYPGSKDEKLLESSIGNMLSAKLGDVCVLEQMISLGKIQLLPLSDIRGFDANGMNAGVYITEAQNMDISLMKLALQRIGEDSVCVVEGDYNAQVDMNQYAGNNNGMRRMSEIFRGQDFYGEVKLENIYRSKIAKIAELM